MTPPLPEVKETQPAPVEDFRQKEPGFSIH